MGAKRDCRVLIVDDDFMVARIHRGFVERMDGFVVAAEVHTAATALSAARRLLPDVILLDVYLPDMSGLRALAELRRNAAAQIDVIVVTAARDAETVSESLRLGARHYLIKPFGFDDLHERLKQVRDLRLRLDSGADQDLGQEDIDQVFGALPDIELDRRNLPKGLSKVTMTSVIVQLKQSNDDHSATSLAQTMGMSRVSVRRYLDFLVRIGWVRLAPRYGEVGRPENQYRWIHD